MKIYLAGGFSEQGSPKYKRDYETGQRMSRQSGHPERPADGTTTAAKWAQEINSSWQNVLAIGGKTVSAIIETGKRLLAAKAALQAAKCDWLDMFDPDRVLEPIPFGVDRAERLMAVARHPILTDSANWRNLPPTISALHELVRLDTKRTCGGGEKYQGVVKDALANGRVWADMTARDVSALRPHPASTNKEGNWNLEKARARLRDGVFAAVETWMVTCPYPLNEMLPLGPEVTFEMYPETALRGIAKYLAEGRERRTLLTQDGVEFLSNAARRLQELARKEGVMRVARRSRGMATPPEEVQRLFTSEENAFLSSQIRGGITELINASYLTPSPARTIRAIEHVIEGKICGPIERALLGKALEAQNAPKAESAEQGICRRVAETACEPGYSMHGGGA